MLQTAIDVQGVPTPLRVLILEDNPSDAVLMEDALRETGYEPHCERVETKQDFTDRLTPELDLILSDYSLPQFDGVQALKLVRERGLNVPFVLVSGNIGEDIAVDAMRNGADDYLLKDRMARLGPSVQRALQQQRLNKEKEQASAEKRKAEARYTDIFESVVEGIAQVAPNGQLITVNPALAHMLGYASPEALIKKVTDGGPDVYAEPAQRARFINEIKRDGVLREFETEFLHASGLKIWVSISGRANFDSNGKLIHYLSIVEDISTRKHHEQHIGKLSRTRAITHNINTAITRFHDRQALFDEVCRIAIEDGKFGLAWIGAYNPQTSEVTQVAGAGLEGCEHIGKPRAVVITGQPRGQHLVATAIIEGKPAYTNDIAAFPDTGGPRRKEALRRGYRSVISLPLTADGMVTGVFSLFVKEPNFFDREEVELLTVVAGNLSFALEHMAKQKKIQRLNRVYAVLSSINAMVIRVRTRQALFDEACRIAVEDGGFDVAWIGDVDPESIKATPVAWSGKDADSFTQIPARGKGTVSRMIKTDKPVYSNDINSPPADGGRRLEAVRRGYQSMIALPLHIENATVCCLSIYTKEKNFFNDDEVKLLSGLADDISFALQAISSREKLEYLSYYDALTGLPNRTLFLDRLNQRLQLPGDAHGKAAVVLLDIERFRNINETLGRRSGDELLKQVAQRLASAFGSEECLTHINADRFGVAVHGVYKAKAIASIVAKKILGCFKEPFAVGSEEEVRVAARAGVAMLPGDGTDTDTVFRNVEAALRNARVAGERYRFYTAEMNNCAAQVLSMETHLRRAVEMQQFVLHYQPKFDLPSGQLCGLEALIRWQDPERGLVAPGLFIPMLEETGLIQDVGKWVIAQALAQHRQWTELGYAAPRIAVNVSAIQLKQDNFVDTVINVVQEAGDNPEALELEITESLMMSGVESNILKLSILRGMGIHVSMDDFGTGYSSLSCIARLPINKIKIDRSFVIGMVGNAQDRAVTSIIVKLAHTLGLRVVAEGVETEEQSQILKDLNCEEVQGYLFGKPLPPEKILPLLCKWK